jgi:hypothetical protein
MTWLHEGWDNWVMSCFVDFFVVYQFRSDVVEE